MKLDYPESRATDAQCGQSVWTVSQELPLFTHCTKLRRSLAQVSLVRSSRAACSLQYAPFLYENAGPAAWFIHRVTDSVLGAAEITRMAGLAARSTVSVALISSRTRAGPCRFISSGYVSPRRSQLLCWRQQLDGLRLGGLVADSKDGRVELRATPQDSFSTGHATVISCWGALGPVWSCGCLTSSG